MSDVQFHLTEFNEVRHLRGVPAARVNVTLDGETNWLWMTRQDAELNIRDFGESPELDRVAEAYRIGRLPPPVKLIEAE